VQRYILESDVQQIVCPNPECRVGWSDDFLDETMTRSFLLGDFKKHREKILLDLERIHLPEAQADAARYKEAKEKTAAITALIEEANNEIAMLPERAAFVNAQKEYYSISRLHANLDESYQTYLSTSRAFRIATSKIYQRIDGLKTKEYKRDMYFVKIFGRERRTRAGANRGEQTERSGWSFVMKCPVNECQGFVGNDWACGLCKASVCKDCRDPTDAEHACDPEKVLSVKALKKEAKPCPNCAAMISKIDGCDQMWCTQCKTAFSWRTGEKQTQVHNPHYYDWMRRNGQTIPRADIPAGPVHQGDCLTPEQVVDNVYHYYYRNPNIADWCRKIRHFRAVRRMYDAQLSTEKETEQRRKLRVKRLVNEITDDDWKIALQRIEKLRKRTTRVLQIIDLFLQAGTDILRGALPTEADRDGIHLQMTELQTYCEDQFTQTEKRFNMVVPSFYEFTQNATRNAVAPALPIAPPVPALPVAPTEVQHI
jgi:hypothetical protein